MNNKTEIRALRNLFDDSTVKTIFGKITERISSSKFKIIDDIERTIIVKSDREWSVGTYVVVQNNFIIRSGKPAGTFKVYRV